MSEKRVVIYGSTTCEDTAIVRDHLQALGVPYDLHQREQDPGAEQVIRRWNDGKIITPTLLLNDGDGKRPEVLSEPALQTLEFKLREAGYRFEPRQALEFRELANTPAPDFTLPVSDGSRLQLNSLRGRSKSVLFFAHGPECLVCAGYARQLLQRKDAFEDFGSRLLIVSQGDVEQAGAWSHEYLSGYPVLADADGAVKARYASYFRREANDVLLLVLDSYTAPRAGSFAADSGGLIIPREAIEWLRLLDNECAE